MLVQFVTDDQYVWDGFRGNFHYIPIQPNCANWLNLTAQLLKSPKYPTFNCSWVITAPSINNNIVIHFENFEVKCSTMFFDFKFLTEGAINVMRSSHIKIKEKLQLTF